MPVDEKKRIEDLKAEIKNVSDVIVWSESNLKLAIDAARDTVARGLSPLDRIETYIRMDNYRLAQFYYEFQSFIPIVHDDLKAISQSTILSSSSIKETIRNTNDNMVGKMQVMSNRSMIAEAVPQNNMMGGVGAIGGLIPPSLIMKLELVLDATAQFLKAWKNPVAVGIALSLPIIAAFGIMFGTVYLIVDRIATSIERITEIAARIGEGGVSGLLFGKGGISGMIFGQDSNSGGEVSNEGAANIVASLESTKTEIKLGLVGLGVALDKINTTNTSIANNINSTSLLLKEILTTSNLTADRMSDVKDAVSGMSRADQGEEGVADTAIAYDPQFQNDLLALLQSTISVRVENLPVTPSETEEPAEVFSKALKPLTANQDALLKSLDSGFRKLNESVISLREMGDNKNVSLMSRSLDSSDVRITDQSEQYILDTTRSILTVISNFSANFETFKNLWSGRNSDRNTNYTPPPQEEDGN